MALVWVALTAAIAALVWAKVTRWFELLFLGAWGILTGALLAGATSLSGLNFESLWGAIF